MGASKPTCMLYKVSGQRSAIQQTFQSPWPMDYSPVDHTLSLQDGEAPTPPYMDQSWPLEVEGGEIQLFVHGGDADENFSRWGGASTNRQPL